MKKVYYLSTCTTCKRILSETGLKEKGFELQDIKTNSLNEEQVDELYKLAGTYEAMFSKVARKYKELGLKNMVLTEEDYKKYLLTDYTFLKRPVVILENDIFIGNSKNNVERLKERTTSL